MTILQMALILSIFLWALRVPEEPVRDRECLSRDCRRIDD
jgi:hypothetical protein